MGVQHIFGTAGATGGGWSAQPGSLQPAFEERSHEPRWCWQRRGPKTWKDKVGWNSWWSYGCRVGGGDAEGYSTSGNGGGLAACDLYEPYSCDGEGTQSQRFIRGSCVDASDVPIANAIVQGFLTATDAFVGQVQANTDGTFTLPTDTAPGAAHYVVAYKPGSPDVAGTSVNTLTSTNVDGS